MVQTITDVTFTITYQNSCAYNPTPQVSLIVLRGVLVSYIQYLYFKQKQPENIILLYFLAPISIASQFLSGINYIYFAHSATSAFVLFFGNGATLWAATTLNVQSLLVFNVVCWSIITNWYKKNSFSNVVKDCFSAENARFWLLLATLAIREILRDNVMDMRILQIIFQVTSLVQIIGMNGVARSTQNMVKLPF